MMASVEDDNLPSPVEVWLSKPHIEIKCRIVHEDESTEEPSVESLSMRGAQREITGWLVSLGYAPVGRWETEWSHEGTGQQETMRRFRVAEKA